MVRWLQLYYQHRWPWSRRSFASARWTFGRSRWFVASSDCGWRGTAAKGASGFGVWSSGISSCCYSCWPCPKSNLNLGSWTWLHFASYSALNLTHREISHFELILSRWIHSSNSRSLACSIITVSSATQRSYPLPPCSASSSAWSWSSQTIADYVFLETAATIAVAVLACLCSIFG